MRCKMQLNRKATVETGWDKDGKPTVELEFMPVSGGGPENDSFFASTPAGELKLSVVNPEAVKDLKPGKSYYIDFSEAPE